MWEIKFGTDSIRYYLTSYSVLLFCRLLGCILAFLDVKSTILGKAHYLLYALSTAIQPRMLVTFDEVFKSLYFNTTNKCALSVGVLTNNCNHLFLIT